MTNNKLTIIYFAHAYRDYNSQYEANCFQNIHAWAHSQSREPYILIDPKSIRMPPRTWMDPEDFKDKMKEDMHNIFYHLIDISDILIAAKMQQYGAYSICVKAEMSYAKLKNKEVIELDSIPPSKPIFEF